MTARRCITSERVYADHAATSPLRPEALEAMLAVYRDDWANASSVHSPGRRARARVERARRQSERRQREVPKYNYDEIPF